MIRRAWNFGLAVTTHREIIGIWCRGGIALPDLGDALGGNNGEDEKYDARIERVEAQITAKLRDRLATAKNANEMFRVFSKFNALFFRPRVRGSTVR